MPSTEFRFRCTPIACCLFAIIALQSAAFAEPSDQELIDGADTRIEQHRKADVVITVLDAAGRPLPGAKVELRQTRHAFLFGCNVFEWSPANDKVTDSPYCQEFKELFNFATLPFYWWAYEPVQGKPNYNQSRLISQWCAQNGITTKGHPLAWNFFDPPWAPDDPMELKRLQMTRIDDCVSRFKGRIDCWDVVNEATHFEREWIIKQAPKMSGLWQKAGRMEFTRECFVHARKANPKATLLINDYRTDPPYEKVIEQLVDKAGKPMYDVIGIQNHMFDGAWPNGKIWDVCQRFSRFGVPLHFTEMTIFSGRKPEGSAWNAAWPTTPQGEAEQARDVVRFYTMLFSHPAVEAIIWWNFRDLDSECWTSSGLCRRDMTSKPAHVELAKLVKSKWWTTAKLVTDKDGTAATRGFLGDYEVTVTANGSKPLSKRVVITKGDKNRCTVKLE